MPLAPLLKAGLVEPTDIIVDSKSGVSGAGRTPKLNANGGRDHWPGCWTTLFAGGGVRGGQVLGASDALGGEPADRPVRTVQDLVQTPIDHVSIIGFEGFKAMTDALGGAPPAG